MADERPLLGGSGEGDPYITKGDGTSYYFQGEVGKRYDFYSSGGISILPRIGVVPNDSEGRTFFSGIDLEIGDWNVYIAPDGMVHVTGPEHYVRIQAKVCSLDAPGHNGCTTEEPHPLMGIPHMNVYVDKHPEPDELSTGLIFSDADNAAIDNEVDG